MLTKKIIESEFSFVESLIGNGQSYCGTDNFDQHGDSCDIYFSSVNRTVTQTQIEIYNSFKKGFKKYLPEIEKFLIQKKKQSQEKISNSIRDSILYFDVVHVPQNDPKYDLVLVCSKTFKRFLWFKSDISIRVEIRNESIISMKITNDTTRDNE